MKIRSILIVLLTVATACSNREQPVLINRLSEVKFPDAEKEAIAKEHIRYIYAFDKAEEFARNPGARKYFG